MRMLERSASREFTADAFAPGVDAGAARAADPAWHGRMSHQPIIRQHTTALTPLLSEQEPTCLV
jgi:hypothetical protein